MIKLSIVTVLYKQTEQELRKVLNEIGCEYTEAIGEAAFYGPKLDVEVKPAVGPEVTLSTCQLDFLLPKRFELTYINEKGEKVTPVVIHRAILGTFDRFTAFILEETKGALPLWLSPTQICVIPVNNNYHLEYAKEINDLLLANNIRVKIDDRDEKLGYKMREAQMQKIPFTLVIGDKEKENNTVTYRKYGDDKQIEINKESRD